MNIFEQVAEHADFGTPSARKAGRNPQWPYVPILVHDDGARQSQLRGLAYATRAEAVARAEAHVEQLRAELAVKLAERKYRALREQYGLARELDDIDPNKKASTE